MLTPPRATSCRIGFGAVWLLALPGLAGDWPAFRGPDGNGIAREATAPVHWGTNRAVRWKFPLPSPGNSSPIISHGRVFVTCAQNEGRQRTLYCIDARSGQELWRKSVEFTSVEPTHRTNPYCASTPVTDGERVIVWHGSAGIYCYDFSGKAIWKQDLGPVRHEWGYASSPIIFRDKIILNFGPGSRSALIALELNSGKLLWRCEEPGGLDATDKRMVGSWATPIMIRVAGKDQILCSMATRVIACDPETGFVLWSCLGLGDAKVDLVYASPLVCDGVGVAFTGWVTGPTIGFKLGGSGDVTESNRLWLEKQPQRLGSGVVIEGKIYIVNAGPGTADCLDCRTGKVRWSERLEGGESWGSVVSAAGRLYVTSRRGVTTVFRPNPDKLEVLASNDLGEASNATPAFADGQIFLRTDAHVYCIGQD